MIEVDHVNWEDPKELGEEFNGIWLEWNWENTKFHHNTDPDEK